MRIWMRAGALGLAMVGWAAVAKAAVETVAAQPYVWRSVTIKANGFIDGIVYSPAKAGVVYIHTDMGGAYRWDDAAKRWVPLNDGSAWNDDAMKSLGVEALAVDPTDANKAYMACGTYMSPTAIRRTTDGGKTWQRVDVPIRSNGNGSARNAGPRMVVDPNAPQIIYYGTRVDGLWKSTDAGVTWQRIGGFPTIGEQMGWGKDTGIIWVCIDRSSGSTGKASQTIYTGVFEKKAGATRIYRSTDAGVTWTAMPGAQVTEANYFPQRVALTPDGKTMYLTYGRSTVYPGPYGIEGGCVRKVSDPAGPSPVWEDVSPKVKYGFSACVLDPKDPNRIYVGEMGDYNPNDRLWRSDDAGRSWRVIDPSPANRDDSSAPYAAASRVHWMGDVEIDPFTSNVAMFVTGYGLYRTTNLLDATPKWTFFNDGFEQSAALELASPSGGPVHLLSAIGDRDGYRHVDFNESPKAGVLGEQNGLAMGSNMDIDVAAKDPNQVVRLGHVKARVQYSTDNGVNWAWFPAAQTGDSGRGRDNLAISADGTRTAYQPAGDARVVISTRIGSTWSAWKAPSTGRPAAGAVLVADLEAPQTFYAFNGETVSRSTDGGDSWSPMTDQAPPMTWVRAVPAHEGHLVGSAGGRGAWRSTDGGKTWARLAPQALSVANVIGVGAGKTSSAYPAIFVGGSCMGQTGFFRSDDQGQSWIRISDADHQYGWVTVIQGDPRVYGRLYVGTNGRGILYGDIAGR